MKIHLILSQKVGSQDKSMHPSSKNITKLHKVLSTLLNVECLDHNLAFPHLVFKVA